ncbi:MAG: 3-deoxy-7-phosphoheptulonate synthase, partial [Cardiobacterium sp.]
MHQTDDLRIARIEELLPPVALLERFPLTAHAAAVVRQTRQDIHAILHDNDPRLLVVIGPCSIHDVKAANEYADRLLPLREKYREQLCLVMRVYFEKPRTTVGWKGLLNDPHLDGSFAINDGLRLGRELLLDLNEKGMPVAVEYLDMIIPQYIA